MYRVYGYNRFQACRFGFDGELVNPFEHTHTRLRDDLLETLERLTPAAAALGTAMPLMSIAALAAREVNDARWLRERYLETKSLPDVVRMQAERWRE